MKPIINYLNVRKKLKEYEEFNNSIKKDMKINYYFEIYDILNDKTIEIISLEKSKFTKINKTKEEVENEISDILKTIYFNKMTKLLSEDDESNSLAYLRGLLSSLNLYQSKYFEGLRKTFISDLEKVLNNHTIIYNNYQKKHSINNTKTDKLVERNNIENSDPMYDEILEFVLNLDAVSTSLIQRQFRLGYNRTVRIIDLFESQGIIGPARGSNPRLVLKNINNNSSKEVFSYFSNTYNSKYTENEKTILEKIDNELDGYEFEEISKEILLKNKFNNVELTKRSSDFGVDLTAEKDGVKYAIQCKKYSSQVGLKAVQEVIASKSMNQSHVAVVLTNNYFTKGAIELAEKNNVLLWDRDKLVELIKKFEK